MTNTLTDYVHVTYGTEAEIREVLGVQSTAWQAKLGPKKAPAQKGAAWRQRFPDTRTNGKTEE